MAKQRKAEEFFYTSDDRADSIKRDADLHNPILRAVDYPIEEKIMQPIRERHRARYLAEQQATQKAARLKSQWARTKAHALRLLAKDAAFDESKHPRDNRGRFSHSGGEAATVEPSPFAHAKDPTSASSLLEIETDVTVDDLYKKVPGSEEQATAAEAKIADSGPETRSLYKLPNGHYAPDRLPVHRKIVNELMPPEAVAAAVPPPGEPPTLYILGGRGGSGKGWYTDKRRGGTIANVKAVYINSDDVKEKMPEWKGWNAGVVHEEASDIGEDMERYARDNKLNVIVDVTLKSEESAAKRIKAYKAAGYKISGHYMYASPATAAQRALERFVGGNKKNGKGRYVRPGYSLNSTTNEHSFDAHRRDMDYWEVYDNMEEGKPPQLHSRKGG